MLNFLKLYNGHLRSSKKVLFIASIGLICALTIVSSTNYYFDTSKELLVQNFLESNGNSYQPDVGFSMTAPLGTYNNSLSTVISDVNVTQQAFSINYFKSIVVNPSLTGLQMPINTTFNGDTAYQQQVNTSVRVVQLNTNFMQELKEINLKGALLPHSILPASNDSATDVYVLFLSNNYYQQSVSNNITVQNTRSTALYDSVNNSQITVKVTGSSALDISQYICSNNGPCQNNPSSDNYPIIKSFAYSFSDYGSQIFVFTPNLQKFTSLVQTAEKTSPVANTNVIFNYGQTSIQINIIIKLDYTKIDPFASSSITSKINSFSQSLNDQLNNALNLQNIHYQFYTQNSFDNLSGQINSLIFMLFLVSLPVLLATIFVINYSFGLIHKNVIQHIGVYKTRGGTAWMLFDFQMLDNLLIMILSILVALVTGIPLSSLVIKTNYLLSFNEPAPAYLVLNFTAVATLLFYTAVIMILIVNMRRLKRLSQMSIVETEQTAETDEPYWKKHFLDVILFGFGMMMYGVFYELAHNPNIAQNLGPIIIVLVILMIPAPFAIIIGLILIINRILPVILNKIGTTLWDRTGNLLAFSFKNVIRHRQASTRAVMLISILLAFMVMFYALPYSLVVNNETNFYYSNGAEGRAQFTSGYNATDVSTIESNFSQYVTISPYVILSAFIPGNNMYVMLVNTSTYLKAAYLHFDLGLTKNLKQDISNLKINASNFSTLNILMDTTALQQRRTTVGSNITINNDQSSIKMHIVDSFKNWPVINSQYQYSTTAIGDISYYLDNLSQSVTGSPFNNIEQSGVFFNFQPGVNQSLVASWIEGNTSLSNINLESVSQKQFTSGIIFRLEVGQINNDVLMVVLISIIVLIMFAYLQLNERKKEIFTERAIGMKLHQIASLFFIETIILTLTSVILGVGVGAFLMELLAILIFNPLQTYPAFEIVFPINLIAITAIIIIICSIIVSTVPAMFVTRQDISKSFGEA